MPPRTDECMEAYPFPNIEFDQEYLEVSSGNLSRDDATDATDPTHSVGSSVFSFTYSNGRRYHSDRFKTADYFMPNDDSEQERLDMYHHIFLLLLQGNLYTAPLETIQLRNVLDAGTGTGIWAMDFADQYPNARVIGTDISPIQPTWVPTNCKFEVDDIEEDWIYPHGYFDYIHMRSLSGAIKDWPRLLQQSFDTLAPGGFCEFQDYSCEVFLSDGTPLHGVYPQYDFATYFYHVTGAAERIGRSLKMGPRIKSIMENAGFVDVVETSKVWPMSDWAKDPHLKELGRWGKLGTAESAYPFALHLLTKEGWTVEQVQDLSEKAAKSLRKGGPKYYVLVWFVYGRKPPNN